MGTTQDAKALSVYATTFVEPDRLTQIAAKAEAGPKAGKKSA